MPIIRRLRRLCFRQRSWEQRGASLVEYALIIALIAVVAIGSVSLYGNNLGNKYSTIGSTVKAQPGG